MFLNVHELERQAIEFEETLPPGKIDFGNDVIQTEPLEIRGSAELLASAIRLRGLLRTTVEISCARCLEPSRRDIEKEFDLFYNPVATIAKEEVVSVSKEELEIGFYHGDGLLLEEVIKEQVLLDLPMKGICREDCSGLCPSCGQNLNLAACGCKVSLGDSSWAPLAKWKD